MNTLVSCHKIYLQGLEICVLFKSLCCGKMLPCTLIVTNKCFGFLVIETKGAAWISTPIRPYSTKVSVICTQFFRVGYFFKNKQNFSLKPLKDSGHKVLEWLLAFGSLVRSETFKNTVLHANKQAIMSVWLLNIRNTRDLDWLPSLSKHGTMR